MERKQKLKEAMPESQNRIDSIIALIMEEAETYKKLNEAERINLVLNKVRARVFKIMRTRRE